MQEKSTYDNNSPILDQMRKKYRINFETFNYPDLSAKGKIFDTSENLKALLDQFNIRVRFNLMSRCREIAIPNHVIFYDERENASLFVIFNICIINEFPTQHLDQHLDNIAWNDTFHPIVDCLRDTPWDGEPRLDDFILTLETEDPFLTLKVVKTWMIAAIAAAHSETGFINQGVIVLQGAQNIGKTSWVRGLAPIKCGAIKEGVFLDPTNKDSISQIASYWIVELGELDSIFGKAAIGRLKSYITMEYDYLRHPYARKATKLVRRTAYIATVNEQRYLIDETGNRRWWTIPVRKIHLNHGLNMQQVWAEVYNLWQQGTISYLNKELQEEVNEANQEFEKIDPLYEILLENYHWEWTARNWATVTEILKDLGYQKPSQSEATKLGKILTKINGKKGRRYGGLTQHEIPAKKVVHIT